ncbi:MAG: hypothetical protein GWN58_22980 [Anaerolineae bacterium]|nr:hypothetical protein [Thermoplasmata archaeon]NIV32240.1 hypothetical protein [Anaerolineae bacterium]NIY03692.1 hypothetical protein [Thermoplasmata archaeon]
MGCCGGEIVAKFRRLQAKLAQKGNLKEATEAGKLADRFERATRKASRIVSRMPKQQRRQAEKPAAVERYYKECKDSPPETAKGRVEEYCSRVAWQIFCQNKDPSYPGCTEYGRTKKTKPE